jgi:peptide deformylase
LGFLLSFFCLLFSVYSAVNLFMILPIAQLGQPVLRSVAEPVPEEFFGAAQFEEFVQRMQATLVEAQGAGLAGPQVFLGRRVFLARVAEGEEEGQAPPAEVFINPTILERSGEPEAAWEGCLSFPELLVLVSRSTRIRVAYRDMRGAEKVLDLEGFQARVVQHEYDHLDGILTIDRAASTRDIVKHSEIQAVLRDRGEIESMPPGAEDR